jgi:hypothetical protein
MRGKKELRSVPADVENKHVDDMPNEEHSCVFTYFLFGNKNLQ